MKEKKRCPNCGIDHDPDWHEKFETDSNRFEQFIDEQLEPQRKADPLHPSNRRPRPDPAGQLDLFGERKAE